MACSPKTEAEQPPPTVLSRDDIVLTVDPDVGGRIASLRFDGVELLQTTRDSANIGWGSVAWTSPQEDWGWPPPKAFDTAPFTVTKLNEYRLLLEGPLDTASMLRMRKRYALGPGNTVGLTYWVTYEGHKSVEVALWENTRLPFAGKFDFATDSVRFWRSEVAIDSTARKGTSTIIIDGRHEEEGKVFTSLKDGYVDWTYRGIRLRKESTVRDHYRVAPGHAPLELFVAPEGNFTEMELQGDYRLLGAGESNNLRTRWTLSRVDE